ncbi:uncharacterized protein LOC110701321 [Chenopodium quinoa]|uniref:uncharacterized protein LOC110701321 n=1 Tax=Chenopodium quinoa TaxID=63459 RepID=UPI000B793CAE|nr:uncharacterized protein LOC110701321 [Chenopodium quinoa]
MVTLAWAAWWCRNKITFDNGSQCPISIATNLTKSVHDYVEYVNKVFLRGGAQRSSSANSWWECPSLGVVKVNVDAHVGSSTGLRVVIRDENGIIRAPAVRKEAAGWAPDLAEATTCRYGLQLAARLGYFSIVLESDAKNVVQGVKMKAIGFTPFSLIIDDICNLSSIFDVCSFSHVKHASNTLANHVARWDSRGCNELVCLGPFPQSLLILAEIDLL